MSLGGLADGCECDSCEAIREKLIIARDNLTEALTIIREEEDSEVGLFVGYIADIMSTLTDTPRGLVHIQSHLAGLLEICRSINSEDSIGKVLHGMAVDSISVSSLDLKELVKAIASRLEGEDIPPEVAAIIAKLKSQNNLH